MPLAMSKAEVRMKKEVRRAPPRPGRPAAHVSDYLALLPSGPDAVRRLRLHRFRTAVRPAGPRPPIVSNGVGHTQHAVPFGVQKTDHRLAMAGFGPAEQGDEFRRAPERIEPRIAG